MDTAAANYIKQQWDTRKGDIANLAPEIITKIYGSNPTEQVQIHNFGSAKKIGAVSNFRDMFAEDDVISLTSATKCCDLDKGKLQPGKLFLATHIQLLFKNTDGSVAEADWDLINYKIANGDLQITQDDRKILERQSMRPFLTAKDVIQEQGNYSTTEAGVTTVSNTRLILEGGIVPIMPKFIVAEKLIQVDARFGAALSANDCLYIRFYGAMNVNI